MDDWSQFPLRQDLLTQSVDKSSSWLDKEQMLDNCSYLVSSYLGQDHYAQCTVVRITTDGAFINQIGLFYCTKNFDLNFPTSDTRQFYNQY